MEKIQWGMIGCGDVTEIKSGPAFSKVPDSSLVAVMRRDGAKAADYARRHGVGKWYDDAHALINDAEVNAVYIATPPSSHEAYAVEAINAGKSVYIEKPVTLDYASAHMIARLAEEKNIKVCIAHYRRGQPLFNKIKELLETKEIGDVRFAQLEFYKRPLDHESLSIPKVAWRVNPSIAGGGLFHDLAPHQLDLMYWFFGRIKRASGYGANQLQIYPADDIVSGQIQFQSGVMFNGLWCFNVAPQQEKDCCEIHGSKGKLSFPVFEHNRIEVYRNGEKDIIPFFPLAHVQQPFIEKVVNYFLGKGPNPCGPEDAATVMKVMDAFTSHQATGPF